MNCYCLQQFFVVIQNRLVLLLFIIQCIEDRNLLVGYLNMYNENYNTAQNLFLKSSNPKAALEVYKNNKYYYYYILLLLNIL